MNGKPIFIKIWFTCHFSYKYSCSSVPLVKFTERRAKTYTIAMLKTKVYKKSKAIVLTMEKSALEKSVVV